jgi:hypothetical protein
MAIVKGTNCGFVTEAPSADPAGSAGGCDAWRDAQKDTTPAGVSVVTEIGVWIDNATQEANMEFGIYTHDAVNDEPDDLIAKGNIAKGTDAGWKKATGLSIPVDPETIYWIAFQLDDTATGTNFNRDDDAGERLFCHNGGQTELPSNWGTTSNKLNRRGAIYAVVESGGEEHSGSFALSGGGVVSATGKKGGISSISLSGSGVLSATSSKGALSSTKWSGLGMDMFTVWDDEDMDTELDILSANGFEYLRLDLPDWDDDEWLAESKEGVIAAVGKGFKVIWGVSAFSAGTLTTSNWSDFSDAVLAAALWAQNNGVYEFQIGNEVNNAIDGITILDSDIPGLMRTIATSAQAIFTNGNISYSIGPWELNNVWDGESRGDIDIIAMNVYRGTPESTDWEDDIDLLISNWGLEHCYITEFNLNPTSIATYSADTDVQAQATSEMIEYFKTAGITRAHYFYWKADAMGVRNADGSYKEKIWNILLTSGAPFISGNGNLSVTGIKGALGIPALSDNGILTFTGSKQGFGSFLLSDTGSQEFLGSKGGIGVFILSDSGELVFTGLKGAIDSFLLSGGGNLLFIGNRERFGAFILSGGGNQTFTGYRVEIRKILRLGYHRSLRL